MIWGSSLFFDFPSDWKLWTVVCLLVLYFAWNCNFRQRVTKINGTIMWNFRLELIILVSTIKKNGKSDIDYSRRRTKVFFQLGLKLPSDMGDFFVEMYILLNLVLFGPWEIVSTVVNKDPLRTVTLMWLILDPCFDLL